MPRMIASNARFADTVQENKRCDAAQCASGRGIPPPTHTHLGVLVRQEKCVYRNNREQVGEDTSVSYLLTSVKVFKKR